MFVEIVVRVPRQIAPITVQLQLCSRYVRQLKFLKRACAHVDEDHSGGDAGLTEGARERIRVRLSQNE